MCVIANYHRATSEGVNNFYNQKVPIPVHELIDKLKNGTAQKDKSTLATIWSTIKEFFCGSDEKKVCDAFYTLFDKNSSQDDRTKALLEFISYFTAESKQPLTWYSAPDGSPSFVVSMKFSEGTFYSLPMAFSELAEAYNQLAYGQFGHKNEKLAKSLYKHINYVSDPNAPEYPNDPKVYENFTKFLADNPHNVSSFADMLKNITNELLFNEIIDSHVRKLIDSEENNSSWMDYLDITKHLEDFSGIRLRERPITNSKKINHSLANFF